MKCKGDVLGKLLFLLTLYSFWIPSEGFVNKTEVNGNEIFFKQTDFEISIPLYIKTDNIPLVKFELEDLKQRSSQKIIYQLKRNVSWLELLPDGNLLFKFGEPSSIKSFWVIARKTFRNQSKQAAAKIAVKILKIKNDKEVHNFCENHACFWDNIQYRMLEGMYNFNQTKLIGNLAPKIYKDFCSNYNFDYKLKNASDLIYIKNRQIFSTGHWNYDWVDSPGPRLQPEVSCHMTAKYGSWGKVVNKTLDIRVVDLNDNPADFVENITYREFGRKHERFTEGKFLFPHFFMMVKDPDTVEVNRRMTFSLLNDTKDIYKVDCIKKSERYENFPDLKTGVYCRFRFKKTGIFNRHLYCVTLQIKQFLHNKKETNLNMVVCAKIEKLKEITDLLGPEKETVQIRKDLETFKIILVTEPPFNPNATVSSAPKLRKTKSSSIMTTTTTRATTTPYVLVTKQIYVPPSHFPYIPPGQIVAPRPTQLNHAEFRKVAEQNLKNIFEQMRRNPSGNNFRMRKRRAIADAADLSTLEENFKAFKMDCIVFTLGLGLFFFLGICIIFYWWINRIQCEIKDQLCRLRLAQADLEADLEANLCTESRMRKGNELPPVLNKITTWNDVAKSCPEFSWPSNNLVS